MNLNAPPPSFSIEQIHDDCDQPYPQLIGTNIHRVSSSSSSVSCHIFMNSTRDHTGYGHNQLYQTDRQEDDAYGYQVNGSSSYEIKNKGETSSLKLTLWKNKEADHDQDYSPDPMATEKCNSNPLKWMSSKMRLMQKMKNKPDPRDLKINTRKLEASSSSFETGHGHDLSSKSSSYSYNNNSPIRVCGDCNTTKTPLWRSGPKGTKSLCNACGIRQRKARRALAAAANGRGVASDQTTTSTALKIEVLSKERHEHATPLKKRYKMADSSSSTTAGSQSNGQRIEDFLMNFSKNLAFHRVFPEDEKDAAILLMALSSGLVHG